MMRSHDSLFDGPRGNARAFDWSATPLGRSSAFTLTLPAAQASRYWTVTDPFIPACNVHR